jgi:hypothetical protein
MFDAGDRASENLVRHGSRVAFSEEDKPNHVENGIATLPLEIPMRNIPGAPLTLNEKSRYGVRNDGLLAYRTLFLPIRRPSTHRVW